MSQAGVPPLQLASLVHAGVQVVPFPTYPVLQAQVSVVIPVGVQVAFRSHPPLFVMHGSVHAPPSP